MSSVLEGLKSRRQKIHKEFQCNSTRVEVCIQCYGGMGFKDES